MGTPMTCGAAPSPAPGTPMPMGLHSSTFQLNVSTFCVISWVHDYDFPPVY